MAESIIDYAMRAQDKRNGLDPDALEGRRQAREVLLEVLVVQVLHQVLQEVL